MNTPMFSIIVPIYNIESYIKQCIDSVLCQTYQNFELILVDDGSKDNCPTICDFYAKREDKIKVIHKNNGGLVSARQAGCGVACGEYIVCVDGDDWLIENHLESLRNIIRKYSPEIICFSYYDVIKGKKIKNVINNQIGLYSKQDIIDKIFPSLIQTESAKSFSMAIWAKAFKKELYISEQLTLNPKIKIGEDAACVIPCIYKAQSLFITQKCLYCYRHNDSSMTKNKKIFQWDGPKLIFEHLEKRIDLDQFDFKQQLDRRTVHALFNVVKSQFYGKGSYFSISADIRKHLKDPVYCNAIKNSQFKKFEKAWLMESALKRRFLFIIFILAKIKKIYV